MKRTLFADTISGLGGSVCWQVRFMPEAERLIRRKPIQSQTDSGLLFYPLTTSGCGELLDSPPHRAFTFDYRSLWQTSNSSL